MFESGLKIDDEILQGILGKSADQKMKTIITSIQREQNRVIRDEINQVLIVQGPAGSGKTSIALHRAAYILYRNRETLDAQSMAIFSPNHVFSDYISEVLPELGEQNIRHTTFKEYAANILGSQWKLEDMYTQMEVILSDIGSAKSVKRATGIRYKSSLEFVRVLKDYVAYFKTKGIIFKDVLLEHQILFSKEELRELFEKDYNYLPIVQRLSKMKQRLLYLLEPMEKEKVNETILILADTGEYLDKNEIKARSILITREFFRPVKQKLEALLALNIIERYGALFENKALFLEISQGVLPEGFEEMYPSIQKGISNGWIAYEDLAPIIFLMGEVGEFAKSSEIKHLIIDEMQDYTPMHYEIMKQLFGHCHLTILGDTSQRIHPYMGLEDINTIADIFHPAKTGMIQLSKSFRSTREITVFCRALQKTQDTFEYIDRGGEKPKIIHATEEQRLLEMLVTDLGHLSQQGHHSIAVVVRTAKSCTEVFEKIRANVDIKLVLSEDDRYHAGLVMMPSTLTKGLEFDAVLVLSVGQDRYAHEEERKLFYTVCTRALHVLHIYHTGAPSPFIESLDSELFTKVSED